MFDTIEELVTEAIGDSYDVEFREALEAELEKLVEVNSELKILKQDSDHLWALKVAGVHRWKKYEHALKTWERGK